MEKQEVNEDQKTIMTVGAISVRSVTSLTFLIQLSILIWRPNILIQEMELIPQEVEVALKRIQENQ